MTNAFLVEPHRRVGAMHRSIAASQYMAITVLRACVRAVVGTVRSCFVLDSQIIKNNENEELEREKKNHEFWFSQQAIKGDIRCG